jgi:GNAT superfamily N-acetyltransferase
VVTTLASVTESTKLQNLAATEVDALSEAFANWPKPCSLFERYAAMAAAGERDVVVAWSGERSVGYLTIAWTSPYQPFAVAGIPEVVDFNVAARQRNRGMGHALMDEAERRIRIRAEFAGIGVGLTAGYGAAQRMYVKRGYLPDGRGIVVDGEPVAPGSMIVVDDSPELMFTKRLR